MEDGLCLVIGAVRLGWFKVEFKAGVGLCLGLFLQEWEEWSRQAFAL